MKKRLLQLSLLLVMSLLPTSVAAQDDVKAIGAAVDTILRVYTQDYIMDPLIRKVLDQNRTAPLGVRIAKAYYNFNEDQGGNYKTRDDGLLAHKLRYFHKQDTVKAMQYIRAALDIDSAYAPAYVLAADMFDYEGRTNEAIAWLERGLAVNPKDSSLYIAEAEILARTDVDAAKAKLSELRQLDPNFLMDRYMARIYEKIDVTGVQYRHQVAEYLGNMDFDIMTRDEIELYVYSLYFSGQAQACNSKAFDALKKYPRSLALNQFYFRTLVQLKKYEEAIDAFRQLQNAEPIPGKPLMELEDSLNYGRALSGTKKYDEAMALFDIIQAKPNLSERQQSNLDIFVSSLMTSRVNDMKKKGEYQQAADMYKAFVDKRRAAGKLTDDNIATYADIYMEWSTELNGTDKYPVLMQADEIYAEGVRTSKENNDAFQYQRVTIQLAFDPDKKKGTAIPFIKDGISMILSKGAPDMLDGGQRARLISFYMTMCLYGLEKHISKKEVADYADKVMDIDPANEDAPKFAAWAAKK